MTKITNSKLSPLQSLAGYWVVWLSPSFWYWDLWFFDIVQSLEMRIQDFPHLIEHIPYEGYTRISFAKNAGMVNGDVWIGNLMIHCTSEDIDTLCSTTLSCAPTIKLVNDFGTEVKANWIEGTFGCRIPASVRIQPEVLNLKNEGVGVFTAFISLPEPYNITDIDNTTVKCVCVSATDGVAADDKMYVAKFDREKLKTCVESGDEVELAVTGMLTTGETFEGSDTIHVIAP